MVSSADLMMQVVLAVGTVACMQGEERRTEHAALWSLSAMAIPRCWGSISINEAVDIVLKMITVSSCDRSAVEMPVNEMFSRTSRIALSELCRNCQCRQD